MGKIYQVVVNGLRGKKTCVDLCDTEEQFKSMTVLQLKEKIKQRLPELPGEECLRFVFTDKVLYEDSRPLCEYGIQHMSDIYVVIKVPGGGGPWPPDREHGDVEWLRLTFTNQRLDEDSRLLCEYGIQHMSDIRMVVWLPGGEGPLPPDREHGGMGDKDGRNQSMEKLSNFHSCN